MTTRLAELMLYFAVHFHSTNINTASISLQLSLLFYLIIILIKFHLVSDSSYRLQYIGLTFNKLIRASQYYKFSIEIMK